MTYKRCACCENETLELGSLHDICPVCGWEDDNVQNKYPDDDGGANHISLNDAKRAFAEGQDIHSLKIAAMKQYNEEQKNSE